MKTKFSLVELLVVIFVVAIVGALGVYTINSSLASARAVKCLNNLSQQGIAYLQLVQATPLTGYPGLNGNLMPKVEDENGISWVDKVKNYGLENTDVFVCPDALEGDRPSYGMNPLALAGWSYPKRQFMGVLLMPEETLPCNYDQLVKPGSTVLVNDTAKITAATADLPAIQWVSEKANWQPYTAFALTNSTPGPGGVTINYGYDWGNNAPDTKLGSMSWDPNRRAYGRHSSSGCGTLFADGHAQMLGIDVLVVPEWGSADCLFDNQ